MKVFLLTAISIAITSGLSNDFKLVSIEVQRDKEQSSVRHTSKALSLAKNLQKQDLYLPDYFKADKLSIRGAVSNIVVNSSGYHCLSIQH